MSGIESSRLPSRPGSGIDWLLLGCFSRYGVSAWKFMGGSSRASKCVPAGPLAYKDVHLAGFRGRLLTNLDLPDGFALGRAVSHGYGWIEREDGTEEGGSPHD